MIVEKLNYIVEGITKDLILYLIEDNGIPLEEAMEAVYMSKTFEKLNNFETHLYYESSAYIYELLKEELKENRKYFN